MNDCKSLAAGADPASAPLAAIVPSLRRVIAGGVPGGGSNLRVETLVGAVQVEFSPTAWKRLVSTLAAYRVKNWFTNFGFQMQLVPLRVGVHAPGAGVAPAGGVPAARGGAVYSC